MKCMGCGDELPAFGKTSVEEGEIESLVAFHYNPEGYAICETEYFCDPECFVEKHGGDT